MDTPSDIIIPPADVREVIDKTAGYIYRNGASFEQRMKERQLDNKQFQFLFDHDAYYGYYNWKLNNYKDGKVDEKVVELESTKKSDGSLVKPRDLEFYCQLLPMSSFDFDVIKMTAMQVAQNDETYVEKLLQRKEYVLEFLNEDHSLNQIFQSFVAQFKQLLNPSTGLIKRIDEYVQDPYKILEDAYARLEYDYQLEKENKDKLELIKKQQLEYASIDWQDFVIVETVEFDELDKVSELPLPTSLADLQYRSLAQKKLHSLIEEAAPDFDIAPQPQQRPQQPIKTTEVKLPSKPSRPVPKGMKIRPVDSTRGASLSPRVEERMVKSPFSNQMIPESKLKNHIDIAFRDPRYKEERERYELKVRGTNLNTDDVLQNIKNILSKRPADDDDDELESKKRKLQWDGYLKSAKYLTEELNKSVTQEMIDAKRQREIDQPNKIGPH